MGVYEMKVEIVQVSPIPRWYSLKLEMLESTLTNQIYDTLMDNVGMSEYHERLNLDEIEYQEVNEANCTIQLGIDGEEFLVRVQKSWAKP